MRWSEGIAESLKPAVAVWRDISHETNKTKQNEVTTEVAELSVKHQSPVWPTVWTADLSGAVVAAPAVPVLGPQDLPTLWSSLPFPPAWRSSHFLCRLTPLSISPQIEARSPWLYGFFWPYSWGCTKGLTPFLNNIQVWLPRPPLCWLRVFIPTNVNSALLTSSNLTWTFHLSDNFKI